MRKSIPGVVESQVSWMMFLFASLMVIEGCSKTLNKIDEAAYRKEIEEWRERRLTRLKSDTGWLTLCGLFWLKEGEHKFGSDSSNAIIFPPSKSPKVAGSLWLEKGTVRLQSRPSSQVKYKDSLVTALMVKSDEDGLADPTVLNLGTLSFYVIKRGDQLGVRVKDKENPARINFKGLEYFPTDLKWRFEARFEPYEPPKTLQIATILGTVENDSCPGALAFDIEGKTYRLDAVIERGTENQLFIMFSDETSGKETYRLGRQLYTAMPNADKKVILDFNKAYNWPCVFTPFSTCPIPPRQNHLPLRIEAGEKMYAGS
ncbi:MAG: DUF1684 domain-containing protein, partial [Bacteroidota bacterium]